METHQVGAVSEFYQGSIKEGFDFVSRSDSILVLVVRCFEDLLLKIFFLYFGGIEF